MNPQTIAPQTPGLNLGDIYYILFRHKWKIMLCTLVGVGAAAMLYRMESPPYQSEAKLLVRYIISESKTSGPAGSSPTSKIVPDERGASIMTTEMEILNSYDLAREVATAVGAERILAKAGGGKDITAATNLVRGGLRVNVPQSSNVLHISYRHPDPEIVRPVLSEIIDRYLKLHVEAHRAAGMLGDQLAQEADTLKSRLAQTEDELRKATNNAGVISLEQAKEGYGAQMAAIRREIFNYEADLAARLAVYEDIKKRADISQTAPKPDRDGDVPQAVMDEYKTLVTRVNRLQNVEQDFLLQYTRDTARVKEIEAQRTDAELALRTLREKHPALLRLAGPLAAAGPAQTDAVDAATAWTQITAYQAKIKELASQFERLRNEATKLDQKEGNILELRRNKELQEATYRYYAANLEQSRINQTLGNGKVSNISQIQAPSPAYRDRVNFKKIGLTLAAGVFAGLGWAFLIDLYFDRSVRRPVDIERMLRIPLFLSIPRLNAKNLKMLMPAGPSNQTGLVANGSLNGSSRGIAELRPFHESLRDRLIGYFESKNLTHKPKLVGLTGLGGDAGVTTTAAGLARSLSETGEGNVLLVDMTVGHGAAQQFTKGKEACGLDQLLEARDQAHVYENLYVVAENSSSERLSRNLPQRFTKLIPKLKASDFDYIIFDMPTVDQLSITPRLAGFMDMVLLIIESEKTDRDVVQGACALLAESKAHIGVVLNKTKNYVPNRLHQQLMGN
jgi:polysaccharide biosynthesis transport protein